MSGATTETPEASIEEAAALYPKTSYEAARAYEEAMDALPNIEPREGSETAQPESPSSSQTGLRLRMKIWTDPRTLLRYLMPMGLFRDVVKGQPVTDVMYAYAMRDDVTKLVTLTAAEWNTLPFFYFQEDGWAPRANER